MIETPTPGSEFSTCARKECGGRPVVRPVVLVYAPKEKGGGPVPTEFQMALCDACRSRATLEDFDSEEFRKTVLGVLRAMGLADPDWTRSRLTFRLLDRKP